MESSEIWSYGETAEIMNVLHIYAVWACAMIPLGLHKLLLGLVRVQ